MKRIGLYILLWIFIPSLMGQSFHAMRSLDDNLEIATDTNDWRWHRAIKMIPLQKDYSLPHLSLGGEIREQFRYFDHLNFGDVDPGINEEDIYLQHRLNFHTDLRISRFLRIFAQLTSCHATGRNSADHEGDRDDLGVMQAFADFTLYDRMNMYLRIGRQEVTYGMERILALRDGPTIRQNFDGARLMLQSGIFTGDFFLLQPVLYHKGIFDNSRRKNEYISGSYWKASFPGNNLAELYYMNAAFDNSDFAGDTADANRHYAGIRINKTPGSFIYDLEFTWQFGSHGSDNVKAWHLSSQAGYRFKDLPLQPRVLIREAVFSGDRNRSDGENNTFRPVSAKPPVYDLVPIGPTNIIMVSPEMELVITNNLFFTLKYFNVWRYSSNDGMYKSDMREMTRIKDPADINLGRHIINGVAAEVLHHANKHVAILVYGGFFTSGNYIRNTGKGCNIAAFSLRAQYKF